MRVRGIKGSLGIQEIHLCYLDKELKESVPCGFLHHALYRQVTFTDLWILALTIILIVDNPPVDWYFPILPPSLTYC